jgi:hypothetical protein
MGLWVMAGSWCADNLTDGWLPDYIAMRLDRDYEENAKMLVQVGLWFEETRDGEPGWSFHEWGEPGRQPSREQVLADRAANAERQKRARERAKEKREQEESRRESRGRNAVTAPVTNGVSNAAVTGAVTVPPTRPDPTSSSNEEEWSPSAPDDLGVDDTTKKGTRVPENFPVTPQMVKWAREKCPDVDGRTETEKFVRYWEAKPGKEGLKLSWKRTWQNWMTSAQQRINDRTKGRMAGGMQSESNAPRVIPVNDKCLVHPGHRKSSCVVCADEARQRIGSNV